MKVKLLKKLRDKAKKTYWLEYHPNCNRTYWVKTCNQDINTAISMCKTKEEAKEILELKRRDLIESNIWRKLDD